MKVFISWSGAESRQLAEAVRWWLPKVIQEVEPWFSEKDLERGKQWSPEIQQQLEASTFAIVALAGKSYESAWLNFEAGACAGKGKGRIWTYLHGLENEDVKGPLTQFMHATTTKEKTLLLLESVNKNTEKPLGAVELSEIFEVWWPMLEERLKAIKAGPEGKPPGRAPEDMIPEILLLARSLRSDLSEIRSSIATRPEASHSAVEVRLRGIDGEMDTLMSDLARTERALESTADATQQERLRQDALMMTKGLRNLQILRLEILKGRGIGP